MRTLREGALTRRVTCVLMQSVCGGPPHAIYGGHPQALMLFKEAAGPLKGKLRLLGLFGRLALALVLALLMIVMMAAPGDIEGAAWLEP